MYEIANLEEKYFRIFQGVYNDFRLRARDDYRFEIDPLLYEDFIQSFNDGLINCIILLEDTIPTAFLAYTTVPKDVIELYIIHCIGNEDIEVKRTTLLDKFLEDTKSLRKHKNVSYAMLGIQETFKSTACSKGFKVIETGVVNFDLDNKQLIKNTLKSNTNEMPIGYKLTPYRDIYFDDLTKAIFDAFQKSSDYLFDPRFSTLEGCSDIAHKITSQIYGRFLPQASKILLYENQIVGFCLANITGDRIANLPLIGIVEKHRGQKLSSELIKATIIDIIKLQQSGIIDIDELNASLDTNLLSAMNMYNTAGFYESYRYPQAYLQKE